MSCFVGLDLGKRRDHTAFAIVRRDEHRLPWGEISYRGLSLLYVKRIPLGTPYPEVIEIMRHVVSIPELVNNCELVVDATGVGEPVMDLFRRADIGCSISGVTITGGARESSRECYRGAAYNMPKQNLIAALQLALEKNEIRIAHDIPERGFLIEELVNVRNVARDSGQDRIGADRAGEHDDLVIAVSLAVWKSSKKQGHVGERSTRLFI